MIFKRLLSIFLTLCVLFASATCLMGIYASAEEVTTNIVLGTTANRILTNGTDSNFPGYRAFDGKKDDTNKWMANGAQGGTAWIIVDLGDDFDLVKATTTLGVGPNNKRHYYYEIYVADEASFGKKFAETNKQAVFEEIKAKGAKASTVNASNAVVGGTTTTFNAKGRYVLLQFVGCDESNTVSLFEFELFAKGDYSDYKPSELIITCFGDSVTAGMSMTQDNTYPTFLQNRVGSEYLVQNAGDSGEKIADIMARQGSMDIFTKSDITFAAGETKVLISDANSRGFVCDDGLKTRNIMWTPPFGRDLPIEKVTINGETYTLSFENYTGLTDGDTYLIREDATNAVTIPAGTKAKLEEITEVSKNNYCDIYFMGFNGTYENVDHLVSLYQQAIAYRGNDKYIIILPYDKWDSSTAKSKEMYQKFKAAFGDHVIDFVEYLANGGIEKAGITLTETDKAELDAGMVPLSIRYTANKNDVHLNPTSYEMLAQAVYEKGQELKIFAADKKETVSNVKNVALGATADRVLTCDSTYSQHPGYRAFDGKNDDSNKWAADGATNGTAWLIVDLGETYDISKVRPYVGTGTTGKRLYYYNVYIANEGDFEGEFAEENKDNIFESIKTNGILGVQVTSSTSEIGGATSNINLSGRYVLLQFIGSNESNTISLFEFEIFSGKDEIQDKYIVTCYGDSMTEGMGFAVHERYPSVLQTLLGDDYLVQNCGDRGERTTDIMARQGGMPIFTKNDITFQAGKKKILIATGTDRGFIAEDGRSLSWTSPFGRDLPIDKVTINGVTYRIRFENYNWNGATADTYLIREGGSAELEEVTIPAGSEAVLEIISAPKNNYCDIYFMGFNGGYSNIDELVAQYQRMIDYRGNDRYLIVIPFIHWNKPNNQEMYTKFKATFGDHAVDLIEYVQNGVMEEAGLTVTDTDREEMELGLIPVSLRLNETSRTEIHLNAKGYNLLANLLYEQGVKIGLFGGENGDDDTSDDSTSGDTSLTTNKNLAFVDETNQEDRKRVIASHENLYGCGVNAFDGKITDDNYDKWWAEGASGSAYLIIDLGDVYNINGAYIATLLSGARKITYDAYTVSSIGNIEYKAENKEEIAALIKAGSKFILNQTHESFRPYPSLNATGRYVLIEVTRSFYNDEMQNPAGINIVEVEIYGYKFVSTEAEIDDANKTITIPYSWTGATVEKFLNDVKVKGNASVSIEKSSGSTIADGDVIKVNHIYTPGGVATEKAPTTYTVKIADEEEPPYAGDMSNTAPFAAVAFLSVLALAVTSVKVFKKN